MNESRKNAELLIKKVLEEKSFLILSEDEKSLIIEEYNDDMKIESKNYQEYLSLSTTEKLTNIVILVLKEYIGSWHVKSEEMDEISNYMKDIVKD